MQIAEDWAAGEWPLVLADSGIGAERAQLLVIRDTQPEGMAESAYCSPSMGGPALDIYGVIARIGGRAAAGHHVVAAWRDLPAHDSIAVSAILRHELEHAEQWEGWGPRVVDELDAELKRILADQPGRYHETPVERAADDAARDWIVAQYGQEEAARLATGFFPHWQSVPPGARNADLRAATIAALRVEAPEGWQVDVQRP